MEEQELVFNVVNTLSCPIVLVEDKEGDYSVLYANEVMKNLLSQEESQELELTDEFITLIQSYKDESHSDSFTLHDVEIFDKLYNVNFSKNSNHLFIALIEINIDELFENITFHDLTGACSAIVVVLNEEGKVIDANESFLNFVGMKREDVLEKNFFETFIPSDIKVLSHYLEELMSKDSASQHFVTPMKGSTEEVYKINWQVSKIVKQNKNFIIAIGSDITKFVEQNNDLKRQIQSIKVGFEYFPFAIGYMNAEGIFTKMNPGFKKMFRIKNENAKIEFDKIPLFKNNIGFDKMSEHIKLIKEMSYKINHTVGDRTVKIKVDIRMLSGKNESSKLYIVVAQKVKSL